MKMVNAKGEAVYFNRVMKNGREQFVVKALDGQHIMGRDRQKHSSRTFTELHQAEAFLRRAGYSRAKSAKHMIRDPNCRNDRWAVAKLDAIIEGEIRKLAFDPCPGRSRARMPPSAGLRCSSTWKICGGRWVVSWTCIKWAVLCLPLWSETVWRSSRRKLTAWKPPWRRP